jgi:hypothetical protein
MFQMTAPVKSLQQIQPKVPCVMAVQKTVKIWGPMDMFSIAADCLPDNFRHE